MITPILDPGGRRPLYEQLYRHIRGEIEAGRMSAGRTGCPPNGPWPPI